MEQNILSILFLPPISPYPTVVMVYIVQYIETTYNYEALDP